MKFSLKKSDIGLAVILMNWSVCVFLCQGIQPNYAFVALFVVSVTNLIVFDWGKMILRSERDLSRPIELNLLFALSDVKGRATNVDELRLMKEVLLTEIENIDSELEEHGKMEE